ncbi:hypothetical protein ACFW6M_29285 [Streptomyces nigra]|uniref:hypothetical protein n=1 Tax=Streptomyces nigra TaxID=1827580 RepID=UPI00368E4E11
MCAHTRPCPTAACESERGCGLLLVGSFARQNGGKWGATDEGTTIYCELALPGVAQ